MMACALFTAASPGEDRSPIMVSVDASEAPRKIIHSKLLIPAEAGPLTLYYPKWIPGEHGPNGPITDLVGLRMKADGSPLAWQRDDADMFAFHCQVPEGAKAVEAAFDFLSPPATAVGFSSAASITSQLAVLNWNQFVLYPKGRPMGEITLQASLKVPDGWKLATALPIVSQTGDMTQFGPVSLETLVDSTVLCGKHFREIPLASPDRIPHFLDLACDSDAGLQITPELKSKFDKLVAETGALFGARHYKSYRFLVTLSDHVSHFGEEHHECTDIRVAERALVDDTLRLLAIGVFPHEFVHSWNGKYRRPAGMVTKDLQESEKTGLLWVYEGLTQYLGMVLTARCGFWTPYQLHDYLGLTAQEQQGQRGRSWRPLEDTAIAAQLLYRARGDWLAWRRSVDFYDEGIFIWLDVDTLIRQLTHDQKSLDDFCHRFHGGESGPPGVKPYTFETIVEDLNAVAPYDWKDLLSRRIRLPAEHAPLEGLERGGWKLVFSDKPSTFSEARENLDRGMNLNSSIGLSLTADGVVADIIPGMAADRAGIAPGMRLLAVNSRKVSSPQVLRTALIETKSHQGPLELLMENVEFISTYRVDYHDGLRYPHLEAIPGRKDVLDEIIKSRAMTQTTARQ
jgi:predicted metalloprotease with PDZ domain